MTQVLCNNMTCKYYEDHVCTLKSGEGVQHLWRCKCYEESDEAKRIKELWKEHFKE